MPTKLSTVEEAAAALAQGKAVVFPTDTVYGLGVAVNAAESPRPLFDLKERDEDKPVAWLVADAADLTRYGAQVPAYAQKLAEAFWPGELTLVVRASDEVPAAFRSAAGTIGLRMPANDKALELIRAAGAPIATTSANRSGFPPTHVYRAVDRGLVARAGATMSDMQEKSGVASAVVDCTADEPVVLREGTITAAAIQAAL